MTVAPSIRGALVPHDHMAGDVGLDPDVIYPALDLGPDKAQVYVLNGSIAI